MEMFTVPLHIRSFSLGLKRSLNLALVLWVATSFLTASTVLAGTIARHAQHQGHDQHSHSQTWCGWMCAAGQAIEVPCLHLAQNYNPIGWVFAVLPSFIVLILAFSPGSRDPPTAQASRFLKEGV
jgi:hypothetical protein